jgi:hypothetical protein
VMGFFRLWSGHSDSNRGEELGRLTCYRYIMPALRKILFHVP